MNKRHHVLGLGLIALGVWGLGAAAQPVRAAVGRVSIGGPRSALCQLPGSPFDGLAVPAASQTESITIQLDGFANPAEVALWLTLPDGRAYDLESAQTLDGVYDLVVDQQTRYRVEGSGALSYALSPQLPLGCQRLTVHSFSDDATIVRAFAIVPGDPPTNSSATVSATPARLRQNERVTLSAQGFDDGETLALWLTQPDGSVLDLGQLANAGGAATSVELLLPSWLPTGRHSVSAQGLSSGRLASASIELLPGQDVQPQGPAQLLVQYSRNLQRSVFLVNGTGYAVDESVSFWLTYPSGKVLALGDRQTDSQGAIGIGFILNEQFPVGAYHISARGNSSARVAVAPIYLSPASGQDSGAVFHEQKQLPSAE